MTTIASPVTKLTISSGTGRFGGLGGLTALPNAAAVLFTTKRARDLHEITEAGVLLTRTERAILPPCGADDRSRRRIFVDATAGESIRCGLPNWARARQTRRSAAGGRVARQRTLVYEPWMFQPALWRWHGAHRKEFGGVTSRQGCGLYAWAGIGANRERRLVLYIGSSIGNFEHGKRGVAGTGLRGTPAATVCFWVSTW